ncbi:hypothetical protein [Caldimonas tepidiphila]|uniref:hypothetical protein n=1 Tax=Caldimonas tepidiphila TaxID=2315841 RepID=UPI000E5C4430|nr:hypothetical protein [Caldimonas tepidiphila]
MADNTKQTSPKVASLASDTLRNKGSSSTAKTLAASVLSQTGSSNQTGSRVEDLASRVLNSSKYSAATKTLAGSAVSQSNKKR